MGQMTHETVKCIEDAFARKDPDGGFPLTSWEKVQLARAWEELQRLRDSRSTSLRDGMRAITGSLRDGEWADLLTTDADLAALEDEVRKLAETRGA